MPESIESAKFVLEITRGISNEEMADKFGMSRHSLRRRILRAREIIGTPQGLQETDAVMDLRGLINAPQVQSDCTNSNKTKHIETPSKEKIKRVVYFTDAHNQPKLNQDRFYWLANYINDMKPDAIVDGGDFDDFESLCSHVKNETWRGKLKEGLLKDLEYSNKARLILHDNIKVDCPKYITLGNHEQRVWDYENQNPEMWGIPSSMYEAILDTYEWKITKYKEYLNLFGVDFTHVPMNALQRAVGGKMVVRNVAVQSVRDCCFGHTHVMGYHNEPKFGNAEGVSVFNGGTFTPYGYIPDYASWSQKQPWQGCHTITIDKSKGKIISISSISMLDLEHRYG
jgi:hypothetical protein